MTVNLLQKHTVVIQTLVRERGLNALPDEWKKGGAVEAADV